MGESKTRIIEISETPKTKINSDDEEWRAKTKINSDDEEWRAAMLFLGKGPSATLQFLSERPKSLLYAYKSQALDGPCPGGQDGSLAIDHTLRVKQEAWKALGDMPKSQAKREFIKLLTEFMPEWKDWYRDYAQQKIEEGPTDDPSKIVRDFLKRNAFRANL